VVRRYDDPVDVRPAAESGSGGSEPATFLWRGRLYVVRGVLGHWRERRAWWTAPAARALHGEVGPEAEGSAPSQAVVVPAGGSLRGSAGGPVRAALGEEHEVWRVEASPGRAFGSGVYDLCRDLSVNVPGAGGGWRLLRVAD
jgi:hypothetical protein